MGIDELRARHHLSASAAGDYIDCGLLYRLSRLDRVEPDFTPDALIFGAVIHRTLQDFNQARLEGTRLPLGELIRIFEGYWTEAALDNERVRYREGNSFESMTEGGRAILTAYHIELPDDGFHILAAEEPFSFNIDGLPVPVIGVIDLIEEDDSGIVVITDVKTSSRSLAFADIARSIQLTIYHVAAKAMGFSGRQILLRLDCLVKGKKPRLEQTYTIRTDEDERRLFKKLRQVWDGIGKGVFIPNDASWKCHYCVYQASCKRWFDEEEKTCCTRS